MIMAATENDLLQRFIDNEKNSKRWTLISVIAFCGFAFGLIYLGNELKNANKKIEINEANLASALDSANSLNDALAANQVSLENMSNNFNLIKREKDSLIDLLVKQNLASQNNIKTGGIKNIQTIVRDHRKISYKVYIQYMKAYVSESKSIRSLLPEKYSTPEAELITKFSFASAVKYFHDADKQVAQEIADLINNNIDKFKRTPIRIVKLNMNVSRGQLEIWLGKPEQLNTIQIIKKYDSKN